jgi:hypothetical protein
MIVECCRMIEAVLNDGVVGVNAQIAALPMDSPNGGSADTRPSNVTVRNAADADPTIREVDATFPIVVIDVSKPGVAPGQIWSGVRDSEIDLIIAYVVESGDVAKNFRNTDYTLRAIVRSIARGLLAPTKRDTAGSRNGFVISKSSRLRYGPTQQPEYGGVMTGAVEFSLTVRDNQP